MVLQGLREPRDTKERKVTKEISVKPEKQVKLVQPVQLDHPELAVCVVRMDLLETLEIPVQSVCPDSTELEEPKDLKEFPEMLESPE